MRTGDFLDLSVADAEADVRAIPVARGGEVDEDVGLRVQPCGLPHQALKVDPVVEAVEPQHDAVVGVTLAQHPVGHPGVDE